MTETRFNLIFEGRVEPGHDRDEVRSMLQRMFHFDSEGQTQLLNGQPIVLGESMDAATANTFKQALAGAGAVTRLAEADNAAAAKTTQEQRSLHRRILAMRRAQVRTAAIVPDRRQGKDRRR